MKITSLASIARNANFTTLKKQCEPRVVLEQWASGQLSNPTPFYFERNQYSRGRTLKAQPPSKKNALHYGFDAEGAVVRIRHWSGFLERFHEEELFLPSEAGVQLAFRFAHDGALMNAHRYRTEDGRLQLHELSFGTKGTIATETFEWVDGRLSRVVVENWGDRRLVHEFTWDDLGRLQSIAVQGAKPFYSRPAEGESLKVLLPVIRQRLLELIPLVAARVRPDEAAYGLAIVIDEENWRNLLPPALALGFQRERETFLSRYGAKADDMLWNPAELEAFDVPEREWRDPKLAKACERANQHLWQGGKHAVARSFVRSLTEDLRALHWGRVRKVTPDFVVYLTTLEGTLWPGKRTPLPLEPRGAGAASARRASARATR